jgi:hypothetical protein
MEMATEMVMVMVMATGTEMVMGTEMAMGMAMEMETAIPSSVRRMTRSARECVMHSLAGRGTACSA